MENKIRKVNHSTRTAADAQAEHMSSILTNLDILKAALLKQETERAEPTNWAHVGTLADIDSKIQDLVDQVTKRGEYAE